MSARTARWIAWSLVVVYVSLVTIGLTLQFLTGSTYSDIAFPILLIIIPLIGIWPAIGALIISRHPHHPVGWLLSVGLLAVAFDMFFSGYVSFSLNMFAGTLPAMPVALIWLKWSGFPFATTAFTLMILLFPDGRPFSPFWWVVAWTALGTLFFYLPIQAVEPGPVDPFTEIFLNNPLGVSPSLWAILEPFRLVGLAMLALCNLAAVISLILRLRRARGNERQQIKWLVFPAVVYFFSVPLTTSGLLETNAQILGIGIALVVLSVAGMVIATAFAVFKYRLYDIDVIINRTLVYGALTGALALIYYLGVVFLQQLFPASSQFAIVASTLAVAALFSPLRRRIQNAIDRRFYRRKYDAQQTLAAFSADMRDEVELEQLSETLLAVVDETMHPTRVSLWLKEVD